MSSPSPEPPASGGPAPDRSAPLVAGRYEMGERIGSGGMGVVHRATDTRLGREVALKLLAPRLHADGGARQRLLREARAAAALDHPHAAAVYDVGETDDGRLFLAMRFYRGETLRARLDRGPLAPEEAVRIAREVAAGLGAAHRAGIVHRDVKPANVMLAEEGGGTSAKVLDFGIAQTDDVDLTRPGESLGTALYMSPEQMRGEPTDARSDVWSLGAVLYEMLAGRRPFEGAYAAAVGYAVLHEDPPPLAPDLPEGLGAVVARCLAKAPEARFGSMEALEAALAPAGGSRAMGLPDPEPAQAADRAARTSGARGRWRWAAAAAVVAVGAVAGVALWPGSAEAGPQKLVVLPFSASGEDAEPLADGLAEAVTSKLGALGPLRERIRVVPATEVPEEMTAAQAHERFDASLVVAGEVAIEGEALRVTVNLVEVGEEGAVQTDSRRIDAAASSAFALQDAAALDVADMLRVQVSDDAREVLSAGGTENAEANEFYLRGRGVLRGYQSVDDLERARGLFERAIALDPEFALAHAGLAEAQWQTFRRTGDVDWTARALASGQRALDLDDRLPEVHIAVAVVHRGRSEYDEALAAIDRALALSPNDPEAVRRRGQILADMDRREEAERAFLHAIRLAPEFWRPYNNLGVHYLDGGDVERAREQFETGLRIDPVNLSLLSNLGVAAWQEGDFGGSADAAREVLRLNPENGAAAYNLASAALHTGDYAEAAAAAERAVALIPDDYEAHVLLAEARWWAPGQRDRAEPSLREAIRLARRALTVGRSPRPLLAMAEAFALSGQQDSARVYLREIEERLSPEASDVQDVFAAGLVFEMAGERRRALSWLGASTRRCYGLSQIERSPWLRDLRDDPFAASFAPCT